VIETRRSLHAVAEHVLGAALFERKHRFGLRQSTGGFATPEFPFDGGMRRILVWGTDLVVEDDDLHGRKREKSAPLTTLRAAGELTGMTPGLHTDLYQVVTALDLDVPLEVEPGNAALIAELFAVTDAALTVLCHELAAEEPSEIQLWPEHFDLSATIAEVNYGASPGDDEHDSPYLYVGPWKVPGQDEFWNEPFGASLSFETGLSPDDVLAFFREGRDRLLAL
jgi:hypothetical protein